MADRLVIPFFSSPSDSFSPPEVQGRSLPSSAGCSTLLRKAMVSRHDSDDKVSLVATVILSRASVENLFRLVFGYESDPVACSMPRVLLSWTKARQPVQFGFIGQPFQHFMGGSVAGYWVDILWCVNF